MKKRHQTLNELLHDCTVRVQTKGGHGTGFFVAPGLILTCAHVVNRAHQARTPITISLGGKEYTAGPIGDAEIFQDSYPDLALLRVDIRDHPCVYLGTEYHAFIDFYSYGFTADHPEGESTTVECEGIQIDKGTLIKLKKGQVKPGSSGSPLLNHKMGFVCGLINRTRGRSSDLGGTGVPMTTVFAKFPDLQRQNRAFHQRNSVWRDLLEKEVAAKIETVASVEAILYKKPGVIYRADHLIGRKAIIRRISGHLENKFRLVLSGMGGIGKTAIAAELADDFLRRKKYVIWLEAGYASADSLMEAVADCCKKRDLFDKQTGDKRYIALQNIIKESKARFLILDNMWNPAEVEKLLLGVPKKLPVLITSQHRVSIGGNIELAELDKDSALKLLEVSSGGRDFSEDVDAQDLCAQFGYHPYALEIAGRHIQENISPRELRDKLSIGVVDLSPLSIEVFRRRLLEASFAALDTFTQKVLRAFAAFSSHGATSILLAVYLRKSMGEVESSLYKLSARSLIKNRPGTSSYYLHSLIYTYITSFARIKRDNHTAVVAVKNYLCEHSQNFDLIALDLPSILAAIEHAPAEDLIQAMSWLVLGGFPAIASDTYFDARGHTREMLIQLDRAIGSANDLGRDYKKVLPSLLSQYAVAMFDRGQYELALKSFERAMKATTDRRRKIILGGAVARTMAFAGHYTEAKPVFDKLYGSAVEKKDEYLVGFILEQKAWAAGQNEDYETARQVSLDLVNLNEKQFEKLPNLENKEALFFSLLNLGSAILELDKKKKAKIVDAYRYHKRAWDLVGDQPGSRLEAQALKALGEDCALLGRQAEAISYLRKAFFLFGALGITEKQKEIIGMLEKFGFPSDLPSLKRSLK